MADDGEERDVVGGAGIERDGGVSKSMATTMILIGHGFSYMVILLLLI